MVGKKALELEVIEVIEREVSAIRLSEKLFEPEGLFAKLAPAAKERKTLAESELFNAALRKLSRLQKAKADMFMHKIRRANPPVRVTVTLPRSLYSKIKADAKADGVSISEKIRRTVARAKQAAVEAER